MYVSDVRLYACGVVLLLDQSNEAGNQKALFCLVCAGKNCFVVLRQQCFTVQGLLSVSDTVSKPMVKFAGG